MGDTQVDFDDGGDQVMEVCNGGTRLPLDRDPVIVEVVAPSFAAFDMSFKHLDDEAVWKVNWSPSTMESLRRRGAWWVGHRTPSLGGVRR